MAGSAARNTGLILWDKKNEFVGARTATWQNGDVKQRPISLSGNADFLIRSALPAAIDVVQLDAIEPAGNTVAHYSGNLLVTRSGVSKLLPFASTTDPVSGIRVRDLLGGATEVAELQVGS